jgi:hypothetical protein
MPLAFRDMADQPPSLARRLLLGTVALAVLAGGGWWGWQNLKPRSKSAVQTMGVGGGGHGDDVGGTMAGSGMDAPTGIWKPYPELGKPRIRLRDTKGSSGISTVNHSGTQGVKEFLIEAVGTGPACLDFDNDGWVDFYVPDGDVFENYDFVQVPDTERPGRFRPLLKRKAEPRRVHRDQLWRNNGDGTFTDVAPEAGVADERWSFGATAFDYDADGWTDIYVANFGRNRLWRNNGNGTFTDIAPDTGSALNEWTWSTCSGVADIDGDGRLDLYVSAYADPAAEMEKRRGEKGLPMGTPAESIPGRACRWKKVPAYCGPIGLEAQEDTFLRQTGDGSFEDRSREAGFRSRAGAKYGFQVLTWDFDQDGWMDVYVANDSVESFLWMNEKQTDGSRRFREKAEFLGVKYGTAQNPQAGMGAAVADFNRDGHHDVFKTNFSQDYNNMYVQQRLPSGAVYFRDKGLTAMGQAVFYDLSWGCGWYDFDNDRDLDLYVANGHVYKEVDTQPEIGSTYDMFNALFESVEPEVLGFREIGRKAVDRLGPDGAKLDAGDGMDIKACSRGACFADVNNDGRMDLLVTNMNAAPNLIVNDSAPGPDASWAKIVLRQPGLNRDALGANVVVTAGGVVQHFPVIRASSFLGSDDPRLHVGLGSAATFDVKVTWPGPERAQTTFTGLEAGRLHVLDRESGKAESQTMKTFAYPFPK